jgi:phage terminase large subunit-like protein
LRGLFLVQIDYGLRMQVYFYARKEAAKIRKLKRYSPTKFKSADSVYNKAAADYAVAFIQALKHTKGTWAGQSFELIDWQERIIRDVFGVLKPNGYRQFNTAYVEIPKKNGKSELAAAIALLLTCGDGEERAEVYGCAADRQQAAIVFDVAKDMVTMCPALAKRVKIMATQKRLIYVPTGSYYQVLSADVANKHGFNTHGVIFDELHTQPNRKLFDVMTKGSGDARMQPLYFLITTAGDNTNSICYEVHQKALDIIDGRKRDPTFYPVIYGAAQEDDWTDPKVWKKANPSLGITVGMDKVKAAFESARQNPAEENSFRQLRLNQWVKQAVRWMPMDKWDACAFPVDEKSLEGRVCYGGLDLSSSTDITAFVLVFPPADEDDKYCVLPYFWIPEDNIDLRVRRDHVNYDVWKKQSFLQTTEGNVVHYGYIEQFIETLGEKYNIREIAFDRWGAVQMVQNLEGMGFAVIPFGQGFKDMSPPTKELMKLTLEEKIAHGGHPVLRWMLDNIFIRTDPAGNIKADKEKSTEKIDGAVATIMALDRAIRCGNDTGESVYDTRGLLVF